MIWVIAVVCLSVADAYLTQYLVGLGLEELNLFYPLWLLTVGNIIRKRKRRFKMSREFVYDGRSFPDPDPNMTPEEVRQSMSTFFPELANAETKEIKRGDDDIFEFKKRVGTKGVLDTESNVPKEAPPCRLGVCVTKGARYAGGNQTVFDKVKNGICPICEGPLEKQ